jgi:outer membrane protein OmpA-like peptidoglycan-associated protein
MPEPFNAVAPTDQEHEHNTLRDPLQAIKEWELDDAHFDFDSSILLPSMSQELAELAVLVRAHPESPLSVFGHADPTGDIGYNKILSGRRALALFGLLTNQIAIWEHLLATPIGRDDWSKDQRAARIMQGHLTGSTPAPGVPTKPLAQLLPAYMAKLAVDGTGAAFTLPLSRFLGKGADKDGKAAVQGCGESNPLRVFSQQETRRFTDPSEHERRDAENAINRRVTVFLFAPGTEVPPAKWPCPRTREGITGCRARFWSDASARATPTETRREFPADLTTFQCRFYDRLALGARRTPAMRPLVLQLFNEQAKPDGGVPFSLSVEGVTNTGTTDGDGMLRVRIPTSARSAVLRIHDSDVELTITKFPSITQVAGVQLRLRNLGFFAGESDGTVSIELEDAIESFLRVQRESGHPAPVTRNPNDPAFQALLLKEHGS